MLNAGAKGEKQTLAKRDSRPRSFPPELKTCVVIMVCQNSVAAWVQRLKWLLCFRTFMVAAACNYMFVFEVTQTLTARSGLGGPGTRPQPWRKGPRPNSLSFFTWGESSTHSKRAGLHQ
jgi:hypothetical protein